MTAAVQIVLLALLGLLLPLEVRAAPVPEPPDPDEADAADEPEDEDEVEPEPEPEPDADAEPAETAGPEEAGDAEEDAPDEKSTSAKSEGDDDSKDAAEDDKARPRIWQSKYLTLEGYVQPQYTFRVRRNARPRDQREFGAGDTRAGLIVHGHVLPRWSYRIHIVFGARIVGLVTDVDTVDYSGDGTLDNVYLRQEVAPGIAIEQLWANYNPVTVKPKELEIFSLDIRAGQIRVPFSAQNRTQNDSLLFPRRSNTTRAFLASSDLGAELTLGFADKRLAINGGIYNGTGLAVQRDNTRGPMYGGRVEVAPLGAMEYSESDLERGPFRFALGSGLLYRPFKTFDDQGNDTLTRSRDLLASASVRLSVKGFYAQGEFMRRQITDNLSSRPFINTGAYGLLTFFFPVYKNVGLAPLGMFGWAATDESFSPYQRYFTQDGLALYLSNDRRLDAVRVSLLYQGEWRVTEQDTAQGGTIQVQVKF